MVFDSLMDCRYHLRRRVVLDCLIIIYAVSLACAIAGAVAAAYR